MANENKLNRIIMGNPIIPDDGLVLENKGKICFNLYYNPQFNPNPYYIYAYEKLNNIVVCSQIVSQTKKVGKQRFLSEVDNSLTQINGYLAEAKYSKGFLLFGPPSVKGILYKETEKKDRDGGKE